MKADSPNLTLPRLLACLCLILTICLTAGCPKTTIGPPSGPGGTGQTSPDLGHDAGTVQSELRRAQQFMAAGNAAEAEKIYGFLAMRTDLSAPQRVESFKGLAQAATMNRHTFVAMGALENWRASEPGIDSSPAWLELWKNNLTGMPPSEARKHAQALADDATRPWNARAAAASAYAVLLAENRQADNALSYLDRMGRQARSAQELALFEEALHDRLMRVSVPGLQGLAQDLTPANEEKFPHRVIALEQARRMLATNARALPAIEMLERFSRSQPFAHPELLSRVLTQAVAEPVAGDNELALLLPLTGPFAEIGWKIVSGVNAAQWETAANGTKLTVHLINTEAADWLSKLTALPASCRIVGGPLQTSVYAKARSAGALRGRVPFTFTQRLDGADEGRVAWRFFASPEDQVSALLNFAAAQGATTYGILHPDDGYGARMADTFAREVQDRGYAVQKVASYPLNTHEEWTKIVRSYLSVTMKEKDPLPSAAFEATFLPDSWLNSEMLVPNLFFYNEEKQILLATNLWEQELTERNKIDARNFSLSVFPSAWDPTLPTPAAVNLNLLLADAGLPAPDYWTALGYDFVRFAAYLNLSDGAVDANSVNARLSYIDNFAWSMAPIRWNHQGFAAQELGLFTPTEEGYGPVDMEQYKRNLERARYRQAQRIRLIKSK